MRDLIEAYLESKKNAMAPSTLKSERYRLYSIDFALNGEPQDLWKATRHLSPYSRKTTWMRVRAFWKWLETKGMKTSNPYKDWMEENAREFKHIYTKKVPETSFSDAKKAILAIPNEEVRNKALQLLIGGLRYAESFEIEDGYCKGKGSKLRRVYVNESTFSKSYTTFYRALKKATGLKPHDLRKIRATHMARKGMPIDDLCKVFGWEHLNTASSYFAPLQEDKRKEFFSDK